MTMSNDTRQSQSVYLVLDLINDLVNAQGPGSAGAFAVQARERRVLDNTRTAIAKARDAGLRIGYVRVAYAPDYSTHSRPSPTYTRLSGTGMYKMGTWGTEVHPDIAPREGDWDFMKHRVSPFHGTSLDLFLRANDIQRIYCSGVSTNMVVQSLVREGVDRDYEMVVLEDCCSAMSAEEHLAAVQTLLRLAQFTTSDVVEFSHP